MFIAPKSLLITTPAEARLPRLRRRNIWGSRDYKHSAPNGAWRCEPTVSLLNAPCDSSCYAALLTSLTKRISVE